MLTEETIKQTRFFRGVDEKVYLIVAVKKVKLAILIDTIEGGESRLLLDDAEVCSQFIPVLPNFQAFVQNQVMTDKPAVDPKPVKNRTIKRTSERQTSPYKGVKIGKPYADGRTRYEVHYYNKETKRAEYLGTTDNEFLAAAIYAERDGDKEEAARLRAMAAEHQELNPDRPLDGTTRAEAKRTGRTIYVCKRCGLEYKTKGICAGCGNDDMREVKR